VQVRKLASFGVLALQRGVQMVRWGLQPRETIDRPGERRGGRANTAPACRHGGVPVSARSGVAYTDVRLWFPMTCSHRSN
jgi:hypothetical protein